MFLFLREKIRGISRETLLSVKDGACLLIFFPFDLSLHYFQSVPGITSVDKFISFLTESKINLSECGFKGEIS